MRNSLSAICLLLLASLLPDICQVDGKLIQQSLKSTYNGQLFYAQIGVGGEKEPRQTFNLLVSTLYDVTWIPSVEVSRTRGFRNTSSDLFVDRARVLSNTPAGFGGYFFYLHKNTMHVGAQPVGLQQFGVAHRSNPSYEFFLKSKLDGMLGLNAYDSHPDGVDYLFKNMYKQGLIDHLQVSLYINNSATSKDDDDQPKGALVFGGVDQNYYTGEFQFASMEVDPVKSRETQYYDPVVPNRTLIISAIYLDWSRVGDEQRLRTDAPGIPLTMRQDLINLPTPFARLRLDSSAILNIGDRNILKMIHEGFIGGDYHLDDNVFMFNNCQLDNKPDLVFALNGMNLTVTPADYVVEHVLDGAPICLSAFKPYFEGIWVLGTRFLRNYYTLFDYQNHRVGLARPTA